MKNMRNQKKSSVTPKQSFGFDVTKLHQFMLNEHMLSQTGDVENFSHFFKSTKNTDKNSKCQTSVSTDLDTCKNIQNTHQYFSPKEKDTLFWCFFAMSKGKEVYDSLHSRMIVAEKKIKIEYIEKLRENKSMLKSHKLAPLSHVEDQLLNEYCIDLKTFQALCVLDGITCVMSFGRCFYEINVDEDAEETDENLYYLKKTSHVGQRDKYVCSLHNTLPEINLVRTTMFKIDNLSKPIKAMTSYKMEELHNMCNQLGIEIETKMKKKDLYEKIVKELL